jgi:hypothetical protein
MGIVTWTMGVDGSPARGRRWTRGRESGAAEPARVGGEWNTFDQRLASLAIGWLVGLRPKEDACKASYLIGQDTDTP